jgi:hypothetical protein
LSGLPPKQQWKPATALQTILLFLSSFYLPIKISKNYLPRELPPLERDAPLLLPDDLLGALLPDDDELDLLGAL